MRRDILEIDSTFTHATGEQPLRLHDVEAVRLLLSGGSVVDWQRLAFESNDDVDRFLRTHSVDPAKPGSHERLRYVYNEAVSYLEEHLRLRFPQQLRAPADVREVFLWASQWGGFRRTQILSCVILKLMHVIHHMEAADLKFRLPMSEEQVLGLAHRSILRQARSMQDQGLPLVSFYGSRKSRSSVITKLLAKQGAVAATIFDKLRYRVVVRDHDDIFPTLAWFTREMFPFNYVVVSQSTNNLVDPEGLVERLPAELQEEARLRRRPQDVAQPKNEFSGTSYRAINWIVDYPVRIPPSVQNPFAVELGEVVYVNVELQLMNEQTAQHNERGDNAHALYKARQHKRVATRLKRGSRHGPTAE